MYCLLLFHSEFVAEGEGDERGVFRSIGVLDIDVRARCREAGSGVEQVVCVNADHAPPV